MCLRSFHTPWRSSKWRLGNTSAEQTIGHNSVTLPQVPGTIWDALGHLRHLHGGLRSDPGSTGDSCFSGLTLGGQVGYLKASQVTVNASVYAAEMSLLLMRIILLIRLNSLADIWLTYPPSDTPWWLRYLWKRQTGLKVDRTLSGPVGGGQAAWHPKWHQILYEGRWIRFCCLYTFCGQNIGKMWTIFELMPQH